MSRLNDEEPLSSRHVPLVYAAPSLLNPLISTLPLPQIDIGPEYNFEKIQEVKKGIEEILYHEEDLLKSKQVCQELGVMLDHYERAKGTKPIMDQPGRHGRQPLKNVMSMYEKEIHSMLVKSSIHKLPSQDLTVDKENQESHVNSSIHKLTSPSIHKLTAQGLTVDKENQESLVTSFSEFDFDMARGGMLKQDKLHLYSHPLDNNITPIKNKKKRKAYSPTNDSPPSGSTLKKKYVSLEDHDLVLQKMKLVVSMGHVNFQYAEMNDLCTNISLLHKNDRLRLLSEEEIKAIVSIFFNHLREPQSLLKPLTLAQLEEENLKFQLTLGIYAAIGLLLMATLSDPLTSLMVDEEMLEDAILYMKKSLKYYIMPLLEQEAQPIIVDLQTPDSKKKKSVAKTQVNYQKSVYGFLLKFNEALERLTLLLDRAQLPESMMISVLNMALEVFFLEFNHHETQSIALCLLRTLFLRYPKNRSMILDDIFPYIPKMSKKRTFMLHNGSSIHMLTALWMQLVQCSVELPPLEEDSSSTNSYTHAIGYIKNIVQLLLTNSSKTEEQGYKPMLSIVVEDLLQCFPLPEWPCAEILLSYMSHSLPHFTQHRQDLSLSHDFVGLCIELLGNILSYLLKLTQSCSTSTFHEKEMKTQILDHLASLSDQNELFKFSRQFWLCRWNLEDPSSEHAPFYRYQWNNTRKTASFEDWEMASPLNIGESMKAHVTRHVVYLHSLKKFTKNLLQLLKHILNSMKDETTNIRFKAMRALSVIIEADISILKDGSVYEAVKSGFYDTSPKVREKSIDLVGKYILLRPGDVTLRYYQFIFDCIQDKSVSVRKRVVKISQTICYLLPSSDIVPQICLRLAGCLKEDIKELVFATFKEMWLSEDGYTPTVPEEFSDQPIAVLTFEEKLTQMIKVVELCHETKAPFQWFGTFLEYLMVKHKVNKILERMVHEMIEMSIKINEEESITMEMMKKERKESQSNEKESQSNEKESQSNEKENSQDDAQILNGDSNTSDKSMDLQHDLDHLKKQRNACLITLNAFSKCLPQLFLPHVDTLVPWLKNYGDAQHDDSVTLIHVLGTLENVMAHLEHPSQEFLDEVQRDLSKLIWKYGMNVIQACVKCMCRIAHASEDDRYLNAMYKQMMGYASQYASEEQASKAKEGDIRMLIRALYTSSLVCKYHDFEGDLKRANFSDFHSLKETQYSDRIETLYKLLTVFWKHPNLSLKLTSLRCIGYLCTYQGILLRSKDIFNMALHETSNENVQNQALTTLSEILNEEESRQHELGKIASSKTNQAMDEIKETLDSSATSTFINDHIVGVLSVALNKNVQIRSSALALIARVLKMAIVHPVQCIPTLIALASDKYEKVRDVAKTTLERFDPSFIENRLAQGFLVSYRFQTKTTGQSQPYRELKMKGTTTTKLESTYLYLFEMFKVKKKTFNAFLYTAARQFEFSHMESENKLDVFYLKHMFYSLLTLPFRREYDVLCLIYQINRVNAFQVDDSKGNLKRYYKNGELGPVPVRDFNTALCAYYLLLLKRLLKDLYHLTQEKCVMFNPSDFAKSIAVSQPDAKVLWSSLPKDIFIADQGWILKKELRDKLYDQLNQEIKADVDDFGMKEKKKTATPRRTPARKKKNMD